MENKNYYSLEEAIKMIPYVLSYGKGVRLIMAQEKKRVAIKKILGSLTTLNPLKQEKIKRLLTKLEIKEAVSLLIAERWRKELDELHFNVCSVSQGIVDVPVWDDTTGQIMFLCISKDVNKNKLFWHLPEEGHLNCRPCWAASETKGKQHSKISRIR